MSDSPRKFEIVCFDVDSTLSTLEGIDVLADGSEDVVALTDKAMNGEIPIEEVYGRRLEIVRPNRVSLEDLGRAYVANIVPGMKELVADLHDAGVEVRMVTAGIDQAVRHLAEYLDLPDERVHAVSVELSDDGEYEGYDESALTARAGGKRITVRNIRSRNKGRIAFVGDGTTDLETKGVVDRFIGFGGVVARDAVLAEADVFVDDVDALRRELLEEEQS